MRKISLTRGMFALIDDEIFDQLNQYKWYLAVKPKGGKNHLYAIHDFRANPDIIKEFGSRHISIHRFIMKPSKNMQIDHIDGNGLNNQRSNLRICTQAQNNQNYGLKSTNKSGIKGVCWHKQANKWRANIKANGKQNHLGLFNTKREAALAYNRAAIEFFGNFARINELIK